MIVPITGTQFYSKNVTPNIGEELKLIKENDNIFADKSIGVYYKDHKIGFLSRRSTYNNEVFEKMKKGNVYGIVWAMFPNNILVELDPQNIRSTVNGD